MPKLKDLASVLRSKNAEPFLTTIDIYFPSKENFELLKDSGTLTKERVSELYKVPVEAVYGVYFIDAVNAAKVTLYKYGEGGYLGQGDPELGDMFGAQLHVPLLDLDVPANGR